MSQFTFVQDDTGSTLAITCLDQDSNVIDISTYTVRAYWQVGADKRSEAMTITDGPNGLAEIAFGARDLVPGTMEVEIKLEDAAGLIVRSQDAITFQVRRRIGT